MRVYVNLYLLRSAPRIPVAQAFKSLESARKNEKVMNEDLVFVKRIETDVDPLEQA